MIMVIHAYEVHSSTIHGKIECLIINLLLSILLYVSMLVCFIVQEDLQAFQEKS